MSIRLFFRVQLVFLYFLLSGSLFAAEFTTVASRGVFTNGNQFNWTTSSTWTKTGSGGLNYPSLAEDNVTINNFTYRLLAILPLNTAGSLVSISTNNNIAVNNCNISGVSSLTIQAGATLTVNNLTLSDNTILNIDAGGTLIVNGVLNLGNAVTVNLNGNLTIHNLTGLSTRINGSSTGSLTINGSGNAIDLALNPSAALLNNLSLNRTNANLSSLNLTADLSIQNNLTINSGAFLNVVGKTLTLNGNSSVLTIFNASTSVLDITTNSTLVLNGTINQIEKIRGSSTSQIIIGGAVGSAGTLSLNPSYNSLSRLVVNKTNNNQESVTIGSIIQIHDEVSLAENAILNAGQEFLIFKSTSSKTARLAALNGTANILGNIVAERYVSGGINQRSYKLLAFPVQSELDQSYKISGISNQVYITGPGGATNGFTAALVNGASIFKYNESLNTGSARKYEGISHINNTVPQATGVYYFHYGPKTQSATNPINNVINAPAPEEVVLSLKGKINKGDIIKTLTKSGNQIYDGWALLANPYLSSINFSSLPKSGLANRLYYYLPETKNFAVYNGADPQNSTLGATAIIEAGQGFFVQANVNNAQITFTESSKVSVAPFQTRSNTKVKLSASLDKVIKVQLIQNTTLYDETIVVYGNQYEDNLSLDDLIKPDVGIASIASVVNGQSLIVNYLQDVDETKIIPLRITSTRNGNFKLNFSKLANFNDFIVELEDKYLHQNIIINPNSEYQFTIDRAIAASFNSRFNLRVSAMQTLPLNKISLQTSSLVNKVMCNWSVFLDEDATAFIERSTDGKIFNQITNVYLSKNNHHYNYIDNSVIDDGTYYYRIRVVSNHGNSYYSAVSSINFSRDNQIFFYPNPATHAIYFKLPMLHYQIEIISSQGAIVIQDSLNASDKFSLEQLSSGTYLIKIFSPLNKLIYTSTLIKN